MKPESCRRRSVFVLTLVGLLVVLPAVLGAADQKDDKGSGADTSVAGTVKRVLKTIDERGKDTDTSVAGTVKDAVGEANGKRVDAINRANETMQNEWNARRQVDEKMNFEQAQKVAGKQQALDAANSHVQQDAKALNKSTVDLNKADVKRGAAEWKELQAKNAYENAQRQADVAKQSAGTGPAKQNAAKLQEKANQLKANYDDATKTATQARENYSKAKQVQAEAKTKLESSKKVATQASHDLETAKANQKAVADRSTTKAGPPTAKTSKIEKLTTAANAVLTASGYGSAVKGVKDAWESGDEDAKRSAGITAVETLAGSLATTPGGAVAAAAYGTAKSVAAATGEAADAVRAGKESGDAAKDAQSMAIAHDLFEASRMAGENGGKPLTAAEARHIAEGYVYGMGDEKSRQAVEDLYKSGVLKDENGNAKSIPQAEKAGGLSDLTAKDVFEASKEGVVDLGAAVIKGFTDGAKTAVEIGKEYADGITDVEVLKEAASQAAEAAKDDASAVGSVLSGEASGEFFKDRVEALEAAAQSVKDKVSETYDNLTGKDTIEDEKKSGERKVAHMLEELGMESGKAAATARDLYSGEDGKMSAASAAIRELRDKVKAAEKAEAEKEAKEESEKEADEAQSLREAEGGELPPAGDVTSIAEDPAGGSLGGFTKDLEVERTGETVSDNAFANLTTAEREQEGRNQQAEISSRITREEGSTAAQEIGRKSAAETAAAQDANSWGDAIADGIEQGVSAGLTAAGASFGGALGDEIGQRAVNSMFGEPKHNNHYDDDWRPSGGGGGAPVASSGDSGHTFTITQVADGNGNPVGKDSTASGEEGSTSSGKKASSGEKASSSGKKASSSGKKASSSGKKSGSKVASSSGKESGDGKDVANNPSRSGSTASNTSSKSKSIKSQKAEMFKENCSYCGKQIPMADVVYQLGKYYHGSCLDKKANDTSNEPLPSWTTMKSDNSNRCQKCGAYMDEEGLTGAMDHQNHIILSVCGKCYRKLTGSPPPGATGP